MIRLEGILLPYTAVAAEKLCGEDLLATPPYN